MSDSTTRTKLFRFRLRTLLLFVVVVGIAAAWMTDRARLKSRIQQNQLEVQILEEQLSAMQSFVSENMPSMAPPGAFGSQNKQWGTADEFVDHMLTLSVDDQAFTALAVPLAGTQEEVFDDVIEQLNDLLGGSDGDERQMALNMIRFMQGYRPDRMDRHSDSIVASIIPLLGDPDNNLSAIGTLESFGPKADAAVESLCSIMNDDTAWSAPAAAIAIGRIDPAIEIETRLEELISSHPDWYTAAFGLGAYMEPRKARRILMKAYKESDDESRRRGLIQALNQVPVQPDQ